MRRTQHGFTLIELMIVITIIGLLAAVLLPDLLSAKTGANILADNANLTNHFSIMERYRSKLKRFPQHGGAQFVLDPWVREVVEHTPENFDKYFTPGLTEADPTYASLRDKVRRGENPWARIEDVTSADTHYAGRDKGHINREMTNATEAWMANDNEGGWSFPDGTVNILLASGKTRTYSYQELEDLFHLPKFSERKNDPVVTAGPDSPIPECTKLAR